MIAYAALWQRVLGECSVRASRLHGPAHWARVERNGLYIVAQTGANADVIKLFALFHDSMRWTDGRDPDHGRRAAEYVRSLRPMLRGLSEANFQRLCEACRWHTARRHHEDVTVGACWDADRLDIGRVGITLSAAFLNTPPAIAIAKSGDLSVLEAWEAEFLRAERSRRLAHGRWPPKGEM